MVWMGRVFWVVMALTVRKHFTGAGASLMNMKAVKTGLVLRQTFDIGYHQDAVLFLSEGNTTG